MKMPKLGCFKNFKLNLHLIEFFLDSRNIIKLLQLDQQNNSYGLSKTVHA